MTDRTKPTAAGDADVEHVKALIKRRASIRAWWAGAGAWEQPGDTQTPVGLALSGGGIRSATFGLGLLQGLAGSSRNALDRIDILSTVSGGGYVGTFFRSLFVPLALRGIKPQEPDVGEGAKTDQYRFARRALASTADERNIVWPPAGETEVRNPIWWLREHSRYLAPTGATDYGFAAAYLARGWLAMLFIFTLACVASAALLVPVEALIAWIVGAPALPQLGGWALSPLIYLAAGPLAASIALMIAYWTTQGMSTNEPEANRQQGNLTRVAGLIATNALAAILLVAMVVTFVSSNDGLSLPEAIDEIMGRLFPLAVALSACATFVGTVAAILLARRLRGALGKDEGNLLTAELRRRLTDTLATSNLILLIVLAIALIGSLGSVVAELLYNSSIGTAPVVFLPMGAFILKKLPEWFGGKEPGGIGSLLKRFAHTVALLIGGLLYGMLAVAAAALVHQVAWGTDGWDGAVNWARFAVLAIVAWVLAIMCGRSTGFINLSSLHALYAARLTRAFLGATNGARLAAVAAKAGAPITENHPADYIQPEIYGCTDLPAPMHLIHVTLNETIDPTSQIVARDRKGCLCTLEPDGVRARDEVMSWKKLAADEPAERMSLGQWMAISGAAASSGMGRLSNLGFALAFTFANVRLGYWWKAPGRYSPAAQLSWFTSPIAQHLGTFVYLANEMTCRYSLGYNRKYLTDGGHYENSGAYSLIRRGVPLILVSDNGADPDYAFEDLQTLIRQVRIDLGGEMAILGGGALNAFLDDHSNVDRSIFVDAGRQASWRAQIANAADPAFALVLRVIIGKAETYVIWIKPTLMPGLPVDIAGYAEAMKPFPQQPTGDQFFDEAQWESYRRLGEETMKRLLDACPRLLADRSVAAAQA